MQKGSQQTSLVLGGHGAPAQSGDSYRLSCLEILDYPDLMFGLSGENKSLFGVGARKTRMLGLMTARARKLDQFRSDFDQCAVTPYKFVKHLSLLQRKRQLKATISHPSVGKTYKVWQCQALVIKWSSTLAAVYRGGNTLETNLVMTFKGCHLHSVWPVSYTLWGKWLDTVDPSDWGWHPRHSGGAGSREHVADTQLLCARLWSCMLTCSLPLLGTVFPA